jgi:hypothetical protein
MIWLPQYVVGYREGRWISKGRFVAIAVRCQAANIRTLATKSRYSHCGTGLAVYDWD